jgi:hypothetical protein
MFPATSFDVGDRYAMLGATFGVMVLLPLSRWLGRPWWLTASAIPVAMFAFIIHYEIGPQPFRPPLMGYPHRGFSAFVTSAVVGLIIGAWMNLGERWHRQLKLLVAATVLAGTAAFVREWLMGMEANWVGLVGPLFGVRLAGRLAYPQMFGAWTAVFAIAAGLRLLRRNQPAVPCPAANTADTSTENPSSSTDVAVSPDLNSP